MTSLLATNAVAADKVAPLYLRVDKDGFPLQKQVPQTITTVTASGALPSVLPDTVILSTSGTALAMTANAAAVVNALGRTVLITGDLTNAKAHTVTFPANTLQGTDAVATFDADATAFILLRFITSTKAQILAQSGITLS